MAVVPVTQTDTGDEFQQWSIPIQAVQHTSFIPRGVRTYRGSVAVPAKLAADQTRVSITYTFPGSFCYLIKNFTARFTSDDQTNDFDAEGCLEYSFLEAPMIPVTSKGLNHSGGTLKASRIYHMESQYPRYFMSGADSMTLNLADVSSDASTAGDVFWRLDFHVLDVAQCNDWPVNSPIPVIQY